MNTCLIFTHPINAFAIHVCNKILRPNLDGVIFDLDQNGSLRLLDTESLLKNDFTVLDVRSRSLGLLYILMAGSRFPWFQWFVTNHRPLLYQSMTF